MIFEIFMIIELRCIADEVQKKSLINDNDDGSCHLFLMLLQSFVSLSLMLLSSITLLLFILSQGEQ